VALLGVHVGSFQRPQNPQGPPDHTRRPPQDAPKSIRSHEHERPKGTQLRFHDSALQAQPIASDPGGRDADPKNTIRMPFASCLHTCCHGLDPSYRKIWLVCRDDIAPILRDPRHTRTTRIGSRVCYFIKTQIGSELALKFSPGPQNPLLRDIFKMPRQNVSLGPRGPIPEPVLVRFCFYIQIHMHGNLSWWSWYVLGL
jgi:hypothetical protein